VGYPRSSLSVFDKKSSTPTPAVSAPSGLYVASLCTSVRLELMKMEQLSAPILFIGFILSLFIKHYTLERTVVRTGGKEEEVEMKKVEVEEKEV
jgi:hypothetical protein